jgi:plasmid stabilization system protein ParE
MREIILSRTAAIKLENLLNYLEGEWSSRVKQKFIQKLDNSIHLIQNYPLSFEKSEIKIDLYRCVVTKQTTLYYKFDSKKVYIVTVFDNRMNPKKLKKETK